ncbi:MAG: flagellar biosynthesis protein FlhF [Thiobacillus sp. 63-78]|uniref:flagellar biosynthesis protein FlhF n=1 Tax=Thiobacillus sp. 63-78 TaxID=1895859 RepID=UPI000868E57D|nr:flagellar biosynthesis protein FlhF [Thiobacillus sp. 63-78]MBN8765554.1 flagellar biosynthesis protein FlhF [Thiobacillus sp.]MBN8774785.1 flagellar biosynthesis protein FlhF [Thiobacillus sp.]ODV11122.1 MAG: flagellar biosynthesis protein FlhF [Thiobacillus sp. SCN 64-317]OJZ16660.1 MAG: flagellar biosynthesis protein FlhF [Thiobacillus sp. 63-78]
MNVKRIVARTSREAMRQLRDALGPDAVILSNRAVEGGVEVLALPAEDIAAMAPPVVDEPVVSLSHRATMREMPPETEPEPEVTIKRRLIERVAVPTEDSAQLAQSVVGELRGEIKAMQARLESQLADLAWRDLPGRDPAGASVMRDMLAAGFSATLAREMLETLPKGDAEQAQVWMRNTLMKRLNVMQSETDMLDGGGVFALMGPTGAGKTTTTAKLAARFVVRHGADKLALLTTDSYRIGGHEQLRIYGKILGVTVHAVRDAADLRLALSELRSKHTVLIDTVGMSQRDQAVAEQVEMLFQAGKQIKRLLLLNATSHGDTLNEVVQAYQTRGLDGCILSKVDEAASLGPALDCAIRHELNVHYLATGQRVPEDLHLANRQYLIHRAFKTRTLSSPWQLDDSELAFAMSGVQSIQRESAVALG